MTLGTREGVINSYSAELREIMKNNFSISAILYTIFSTANKILIANFYCKMNNLTIIAMKKAQLN